MAADAVLVASGTATLEAALLKRPMAIAYKMSPTSYRLMKGMGYLPYVGLPNILAGKFVVPEFIQHDATPENLAQALLNFYTDKETCARIADVFHDIHLQLKQNTAERAANAILCMLPAGRLTEAVMFRGADQVRPSSDLSASRNWHVRYVEVPGCDPRPTH